MGKGLFSTHHAFVSLQVVAGFRFKLRFDMRKTTCTKADHKDLNKLCVPDSQSVVNMETKHISPPTIHDIFQAYITQLFCLYLCVQEFRNCKSTVDVAPWRLEAPGVQIECEDGPLPPMVRPIFHNIVIDFNFFFS